jgi:hypothetical protein
MKRALIFLVALAATPGFSQDDILPRPPKGAPRDNELARLVRNTRVGEAQHYRNLVVYPLFTSGRARRGYWTLDEALTKGAMRISEKGEGSVPELLVENLADEPIFLLAGEIVTGGKQNRVISQDVLLPPRSGLISLGVFCVEQGRWTHQTKYFAVEGDLAHGRLREQLSSSFASQGDVWSEVERKAGAVAPAAPGRTRYLGNIYEDREVQKSVEQYTKPIVLPGDANGMAVVIGGRVVGVEIFGDSETFGKLRDKLLRSYAVDAIEYAFEPKPIAGRELIEDFLRRADSARLVPKRMIGIGRLFGVECAGMYGSVLVWHEQRGARGVVHASLFAESRMEERLPIVPLPRPLPRYRD